MTMDQVFLESTLKTAGALLGAPARRGRKRRSRFRNAAKARPLHEAGVLSPRDRAMLTDAIEHERRFLRDEPHQDHLSPLPSAVERELATLQEQVESLPSGWSATDGGAFSHPVHGSVHVQPDGRWQHRDKGGVIRKSGTTQESMRGYLGDLGNSGAADANAEALAVVGRIRARELGESPRPSLATAKLVEAIRTREVGRTVPASGEDLHAKMRGKLGQS